MPALRHPALPIATLLFLVASAKPNVAQTERIMQEFAAKKLKSRFGLFVGSSLFLGDFSFVFFLGVFFLGVCSFLGIHCKTLYVNRRDLVGP